MPDNTIDYGPDPSVSGKTLYAELKCPAGQWNGTILEAYTAANWLSYRVPLTEGSKVGEFSVAVPAALPAGNTYTVTVRQRAGSTADSELPTDPGPGGGSPAIFRAYWDGTTLTAADSVSVWTAPSRTLSGFSFAVSVNMSQALPAPRAQDSNVAPNLGDALQASYTNAYGAESESGTSYVKKAWDGTIVRTFTLTLDTNSNPTARS